MDDILQDLRANGLTTRDRALERLKACSFEDADCRKACEDFCLAACEGKTWEQRQVGVQASSILIERCYSESFSNALLPHAKRLLVDEDVRVRQVLALLVEEWAKKRKLDFWHEFGSVIIADVLKCRERLPVSEEALQVRWQQVNRECHETEGWGSLETSMRCLSAMMRGVGPSFHLSPDLLDLLSTCTDHSNRYVREYAYFAIASAASITTSQDWFLPLLSKGLKDNWSQVRYAASVVARSLVHNACFDLNAAAPFIVPLMCLNRHYVAEGVRLYSQETWRLMMPATGGAPVMIAVLPEVVAAYVEATNAPNHAVREAACKCVSELASRIAGSPEAPTPFRNAFTPQIVEQLTNALLSAFHDESWPVRDVASTAMAYFVHAFPKEMDAHKDELLRLWLWQLGDNIPSMRKNGAWSLVHAAKRYEETYVPLIADRLPEMLQAVLTQPKDSKTFAQYTPSGPFSVPQKKHMAHEDYTPEPAVNNQVMYSCGSLAPKTLKQFKDKGGCMNCTVHRDAQPWETTEGASHLMSELSQWPNPRAQEIVRACVPLFCASFNVDHFPHHVNLKSTMCDILPTLLPVLGPNAFTDIHSKLEDASSQDAHRNLKSLAQKALSAFAA